MTGSDPRTKAVIYAAKSTEDKRGSIPTQLTDCREMADREGWQVLAEYRDEAMSGWSGDRGPGLAAAMEHAERESPSILVVQHSDRLARGDARKARHLVEVVTWAVKAGVTIRSVQDDLFADERMSVLMGALMGMRNSEDSERKSGATKAGKRRRAERGDSNAPLPLGYRIEHTVDERGQPVTRRVPDPAEAPVVRRMFEMLDQGCDVGEITKWANTTGVKPSKRKDSNVFYRTYVRRLLANPFYGGKTRSYGELRDGNHEALMPWEEFERISSKLPKRGQPKARGGKRSSVALLSGVLFCARCGKGIWHRRGNRAYCCSSVRQTTGTCDSVPFDAALADRLVVAHLDGLFVDFETWLKEVGAQRQSNRRDLERQLVSLGKRIDGTDREEGLFRAEYRKQVQAGNERAGALAVEELDRIAGERRVLEEAASDLEARIAEWDGFNPVDSMLDFWSELSSGIRSGVVNADSVREANRALRERFEKIVVDSPPGGPAHMEFVLRTAPDDPAYREWEAEWMAGEVDGKPYSEEKAKEWALRSWPPLLPCTTDAVRTAEGGQTGPSTTVK